MTPSERAQGVFGYFLRNGWTEERFRDPITKGIELAITAAVADATRTDDKPDTSTPPKEIQIRLSVHERGRAVGLEMSSLFVERYPDYAEAAIALKQKLDALGIELKNPDEFKIKSLLHLIALYKQGGRTAEECRLILGIRRGRLLDVFNRYVSHLAASEKSP